MSGNPANTRTASSDDSQSVRAEYGLDNYGFRDLGNTYWNLEADALIQKVADRSEGSVTNAGQVLVATGNHTDLANCDKFVVREGATEDKVWWGEFHRPFDLRKYSAIYRRVLGYAVGRHLFVQDCYSGADPEHRLPVRVISEFAWHSLVARNLFTPPDSAEEYRAFVPQFTVIIVPSFRSLPEVDGTDSDTFVLLNLDQGICLIGGTAHSGEIKKAVFAAQNFLETRNGILALHSSVNIDSDGAVALFAGPCGSGKTTLAVDPACSLLGDDEHTWHDDGLTSLGGGCYARMIGISSTTAPAIHKAVQTHGVVLENVASDRSTDNLDLEDAELKDNARASFPLDQIVCSASERTCGHPRDLFVLICDATGVLPPIAQMTPDQAAYYFLSGYSCRVAVGNGELQSSPEQIFDPCFDAHSTIQHPGRQALGLRDKIVRYGVRCWLLNTGWIGGPQGHGKRISIDQTRGLIQAARSGKILQTEFKTDQVFGLKVPVKFDGLPDHSWANPDQFEEARSQLACQFVDNFKKLREACPAEIAQAGPDLNIRA